MTAQQAESLIKNLRVELADQTTQQIAATKTQEDANKADVEALLIKGKQITAFSLIQKHLKQVAGDTEILEFAQANLGQIFKDNEVALRALGITSKEHLIPVLKDMKDTTDSVATNLNDELGPAIAQISHSFTNQFVNALLEGQNALDSFKSFAQNVVAQIISTFLQLALINPILNNIFSGANGGAGLGLSTLAGGGAIQKNTATLVGERGPEIFVPNTGGTIMNNMNSKNAMGGGTPINIYQNVNFATGVVSTVRAEVTKMMPQIADVTKAAVQESAMRGGSFRRSLVGG